MASLTATVDASLAKVGLVLDWPGVQSATVVRISPTGERVPVSGGDPALLIAGSWTRDDHEAPLDVEVHYEASSPDDAQVLSSSTVTVPSNGKLWLKHPGQPALNTTITPTEAPVMTRSIERGIHYVQGRPNPVVTSQRRYGLSGELAIRTQTEGDMAAIDALLDDGSPLLLQAPAGYGLGNQYISIGDVPREWLLRYLPDARRNWRLPFVVTDRPVGVAAGTAGNTYADRLALFPTYADISSPPVPDPTWSFDPSKPRKLQVIIVAYSGVSLTNPIDAQAYAQRAAVGTTTTAPSVVTTVADALVLSLFGEKSTTVAITTVITDPPGTTRRIAAIGTGGTAASALGVDALQAVAGATPTRSATYDAATGNGLGATIALRPASGTTPIAYRSSSTAGLTGGVQTPLSTVTCPIPAGVAGGDLMIAMFVSADTVNGAPLVAEPAGWTKIRPHTTNNGSMSTALYYRFRTGRTYADPLVA